MLGYDPLPPLDTIYSYVRPERYFLPCSFAHTAPRSVLGLGGVLLPQSPALREYGDLGSRISCCRPCVFTYLSS